MSGTLETQTGAVRLARRIQNVLDALIGAILTVITAALIYQIFGRYVVGRAPSWTEEVARILIVWLTMLGAAACLRGGSHEFQSFPAIGLRSVHVHVAPEISGLDQAWQRAGSGGVEFTAVLP